jgi:2,3-dihydroxybenzoate decarboxylase
MIGKIALEEHFATEETLRDSPEYAVPGTWSVLERRLRDLEGERITQMDAHGIELSVVSLNAPGVQAMFDVRRAVECARTANDVLAAAIARRPDRLAAFAALPMQDPDAAIGEMRRAVTELGFKGVLVNGFSQVRDARTVLYYDDPGYAPFWQAVAELGVPFYLHPRDPLPERAPIYDGHPWLRGAVWAFGVETATHALRLMASGLFDRHPGLTIILGHLGEGLPFNIWRVDHRLAKGRGDIPARRPMADYLRTNFYLTTSGNFRTSTLVDAMSEVGADRILFSVDYPFEEVSEAANWFDGIEMGESDRRAIGRTNAATLLRLPVPAGR